MKILRILSVVCLAVLIPDALDTESKYNKLKVL